MAKRPVSFEDVLNFERASTATYFDSDGVLQTAAVDEPRFDHDPVTGEALGVLIESSATNLKLNSNTTSGFSASQRFIVELDESEPYAGAPSVKLTTKEATGNAIYTLYSPSTSQMTFRAAFKNFGTQSPRLLIRNDTTGVNVLYAEILENSASVLSGTGEARLVQEGGGWHSLQLTPESTFSEGDNIRVYLFLGNSEVGASFNASGFQFEQGPVATSYIPTAGSPVTRAADIITTRGDI